MAGRSKKVKGHLRAMRFGVQATAWSLALAGFSAAAHQLPPPPTFVDATEAVGIRFRHDNGASGRFLYPELFGGGVAVLDVDGDRWSDLLFVNASRPARHGLYRNNRDGTFTDVSAGSGLDAADLYALGASVADYDNDGRDDLFLTSAMAGGRFTRGQRTVRRRHRTAGITNSDFAVRRVAHYDRDGLADLFAGNTSSGRRARGGAAVGRAGYCGPDAYWPRAPKLYRTAAAGVLRTTRTAGLGSRWTSDGRGRSRSRHGWVADVFVASDRVPARLFRNDRRGLRGRRRSGSGASEVAARGRTWVRTALTSIIRLSDLVVGTSPTRCAGLSNVDGALRRRRAALGVGRMTVACDRRSSSRYDWTASGYLRGQRRDRRPQGRDARACAASRR
jgi:hypothetical protein